MKVLVTVPHSHLRGGVVSYYNSLRKYCSVEIDFFELGALKNEETAFQKTMHLFGDWRGFHQLLKKNLRKYCLIHINPSFRYASLARDGILLRIAKSLHQNALVSFHGWDRQCERSVDKYFFNFFFSTFNKADSFVVLASEFKKHLRDWGFTQPIYVETTPVDDELVEDFSIRQRINRIQSSKPKQILFLSRIEKEKGICETIEAFSRLSARYGDLRLVIAGDGSFLKQACGLSKTMGLEKKISFSGYVTGEKRREVFLNSDIYVLPSYGEGMPTSVLEAMAFGLPVVTRPVGGLKDFFVNGRHGFMSESKDPNVISSLIEKIILDDKLRQRMNIATHKAATESFLASKVAKRLEDIYQCIPPKVAM